MTSFLKVILVVQPLLSRKNKTAEKTFVTLNPVSNNIVSP